MRRRLPTLVLLLATTALAGCDDAVSGIDRTSPDEAATPSYETFRGELESYVGEAVTVEATVADVAGEHAFTVAPASPGGEPLPVFSANPVEVRADTTVSITAVVNRSFSDAAVEDSLGIVLDDDLYSRWEGEPYLVASRVTPADAG